MGYGVSFNQQELKVKESFMSKKSNSVYSVEWRVVQGHIIDINIYRHDIEISDHWLGNV